MYFIPLLYFKAQKTALIKLSNRPKYLGYSGSCLNTIQSPALNLMNLSRMGMVRSSLVCLIR